MAGKKVIVDNLWEVTIPKGFIYNTDKNIIGSHRNIIIMEDKEGNDFSDPFNATISFTSHEMDGKGVGILVAHQMFDTMFNGTKTVFKDNGRIFVAHSFEGRDTNDDGTTLDTFILYVGTKTKVSSIQVFFNNSDMFVLDQAALVDEVAKSIRPVIYKGYKEKNGLEQLSFKNGKEVTIDGKFILPIPDGFHYSTATSVISDQRLIAIVPEDYKLGDDPNEAPYALTVLSNDINIGTDYREEHSDIIKDFLADNFPLFQRELVGKVVSRDKLGIFYQYYYDDSDTSWNKVYAVIFAKDKAYISSIMYNHKGIDSTKDKVINYFLDVTFDWLERIRLKGERKPLPDDNVEGKAEGTRIYLFEGDKVSKLEKSQKGVKKVATTKRSTNVRDDISYLDSAAKGTKKSESFDGSFTIAEVKEKNIKLKNGVVSKKYAARFVPISEFLEDGMLYSVASKYYLTDESDNIDEITAALNRYLDIFSDEERYDIKYGCLNNTTPLHALRSFAWTSTETFNKGNRDHLDTGINADLLLDLAGFIHDRDYANYKVIKSDSLRFGYPIIPKEETNCWYPVESDDFEFRYTFKNGYFDLAHYSGIHYSLWSVIRMLKEMIPFMNIFFEACKDDGMDENVTEASRKILEGWCYYASAIKSPFALIASDDLKTSKTPEEIYKETEVESELNRIETQNGITTYNNVIIDINSDDIGNEFVIPEGITKIIEKGVALKFNSYKKDKMVRMVYPSTFVGTVYYLPHTKDLVINSNVDELNIEEASRDAYKDGSDLEKIEINGNVKKILHNTFHSKKIKQIKLSDTIEYIGFSLFSKELTSIKLPDSLKELENGTFTYCNLKAVTIPENLEMIEKNALGFDISGIRFEAYKDSVGYETIKKHLASENVRNSIALIEPIWMKQALSFSSKICAEYSSSLQTHDIKEKIMDIINSTLENNEIYSKGRKKIISNIYSDELGIVKETVANCETLEELKTKLPDLLAEDIPKVKKAREIKKTKDLIIEKKLHISRLEKEEKEKEAKVADYEKQIIEKKNALAEKENSLDYSLEEKNYHMTSAINTQKNVVYKLEEQIKEIESSLEETSKELDNAGFFKFSLKKELNARLESLRNQLSDLKDKNSNEKKVLDDLLKEYDEKVKFPSDEMEKMKKDISTDEFTKRQIAIAIDSSNKSIEGYKKEILVLEERLKQLEEK